MKLIIVTFCLALAVTVTATDVSKTVDKELTTKIVNALSDCAGVHMALTKLYDADDTASVEMLRALARGGRLSAAYVLAMEASKTDKPRPIGSFDDYIDPIAKMGELRVTGIIERMDSAALKAEQDRCAKLMPLQKELIQQMRDARAERPAN